MRVFVVWEPVILTDLAPPTSAVLARLSDARGSQLYDEDRLLSRRLIQWDTLAASDGEEERQEGQGMGESEDGVDGVVWDQVLIYPPGARWETRLPAPDF